MALIDLALTPKELAEEAAEEGPGDNGATDEPKYPWGLAICLDEDLIAKLGVDTSMFQIGSSLGFEAKATVTGVNANQTADGETHVNINLQITAIDLTPDNDEDDKTSPNEMASALFGKK